MNVEKILEIVKSEMKPSMGCTEPVAIGLAVSNTCRYLTKPAKHLKLKVSSNIFKNAYCVKIPNTTEAGIPLAATLGYLLTKPDNTMEIFSGVNQELVKKSYELLSQNFVEIEAMSDIRFYIEVTATNDEETVNTLTLDKHDNLVRVVKNGKVELDNATENGAATEEYDITQHTVEELIHLAQTIALNDIAFIKTAIEMNQTVAEAGLKTPYGLSIGKNIKEMLEKGLIPDDLFYHVKMTVSAASDCRMGGGSYPAMTVLGSGNQGFQTTLPVIAAAQFMKCSEENLIRGVFMSVLLTIRQKYKVGRLSPICGATLAAASASAAITWYMGGTVQQMKGAMQNIYSNLTGMMCDGAKDGCAMKLSTCSGEAVMAARLAIAGSIASKTDGIVSEQVEDTIDNIAVLSKVGMAPVDMNVIHIMMNKEAK